MTAYTASNVENVFSEHITDWNVNIGFIDQAIIDMKRILDQIRSELGDTYEDMDTLEMYLGRVNEMEELLGKGMYEQVANKLESMMENVEYDVDPSAEL